MSSPSTLRCELCNALMQNETNTAVALALKPVLNWCSHGFLPQLGSAGDLITAVGWPAQLRAVAEAERRAECPRSHSEPIP